MTPTPVTALYTFPVKGEPGIEHSEIGVQADGLAGDRPKKAAVSIVGNDSPSTRSNIVLDAPSSEVESLIGSLVRIGEVVLAVERPAGSCPGVYAAVAETGTLRVGDTLTLEDDVHPPEG